MQKEGLGVWFQILSSLYDSILQRVVEGLRQWDSLFVRTAMTRSPLFSKHLGLLQNPKQTRCRVCKGNTQRQEEDDPSIVLCVNVTCIMFNKPQEVKNDEKN